MKHPTVIAIWIVLLFICAQITGLFVLQKYMVIKAGGISYRTVPSFFGIPIERPDITPTAMGSFMLLALLVGTLLVFLILAHGFVWLWRFWYGFAVVLCLHVALASLLDAPLAGALAIAFGLWKIFKPSMIIHNATEVMIHGGLAAIFVPLLSVPTMIVVYTLIAAYDAYAVWKSKHMIKLAKFQARSGVFSGFLLPYHVPHKKIIRKIEGKKVLLHKFRTAILGGGDVAFPLLFAGVVQQEYGLVHAVLVATFTAVALFCLLVYGRKDRFYPAIPFLLAGSLAGFALGLLF